MNVKMQRNLNCVLYKNKKCSNTAYISKLKERRGMREGCMSTGSGLFFIFKWYFCLNVWTNRLYNKEDTKSTFHLSELAGRTITGPVIVTMKSAFSKGFC